MPTEFISNIYNLFGKSAKKLKKREYQYQKAQAAAQLANVQGAIAQAQEENPYHQALQTQSMFGRGLGKSSIYSQQRQMLLNSQARQMAALRRNEDIAARGLSLIKRRRKYERRQLPLQLLDKGVEAIGYAAGMGAFG